MRGGFGHARQHFVHRQRAGDPAREIGEHFVRAGALAIYEPIRQPLESLARRLEDDRDECCRDQRQHQIGLAADVRQRADARDYATYDDGDARAEATIDQRAIDHQIDVVQPVTKDRDRDRGDKGQQARPGRRSSETPVRNEAD